MSIMIFGMKMPKNCDRCPFSFVRFFEDYEICRCNLDEGPEDPIEDYERKRPEDCPLIDLPPHGRLIDADMLEKLYEEQRDYFWHWLDKSENPASEAMGYGINWCINTLHDNAITVIPGDEET